MTLYLNNKCIYPLYAASIAIAQCTNNIFGTNCRSMARKNLTDLIKGSAQTVQPHPLGNSKPQQQQQQRPTKYFNNNSTTSKYFKAITPPPVVGSEQQQQPPLPRFYSQGKTSSPTGTPKQGSPRTSPGLLARHYAGCKFSEPPAPAMLPLPPQHWTLTQSSAHMAPTDGTAQLFALSHQQQCLTQQLKVLLKVQA